MTSRSSDRLGALSRRRRDLAAAYATARRRHRGAGQAGAELARTTAALLKEEIRRAKATPLRRAAGKPVTPSLFEEDAQ